MCFTFLRFFTDFAPYQGCLLSPSVASRLKILQNNSKPAVEKVVFRGKLAAVGKNVCVKTWFLKGVLLLE
jgi:hypothetical protein